MTTTDAGARAGPVFVVGSMRSGTTLVRLILDSHPSIAIGPETGFMGSLRGTKDNPTWKYGKDWYTRIGWTEDEVDARLREFYGGMFERYARQQGKPRWGEKTPFHTSHMDEMARVFPDAVFVAIIRHPGAVAASLRRSFHYTWAEALAYWTATNLDMTRSAVRLGPRFALCRYEDLVEVGEPVIRALVDFVGEPWHPDLLEHHRVHRQRGTPRVAEGSTITHDPIDAGRAWRWLGAASPEDLRALEEIGPLAGFFGYDLDDPSARRGEADLSTGGVVSGDALAGRQQAWADRVDFEARPPAPAVDASPQELARQLDSTRRALARVRSRRSVRLADAVRRIQEGRSYAAVLEAISILRGPAVPGGGGGRS